MAKNLRGKLQPNDKVSIFDVNGESMMGFETEFKGSQGAQLELAASAPDASKDAVSLFPVVTLNTRAGSYPIPSPA